MDELALYKRAFRALSESSSEEALAATLDAMIETTGADRGFVVVSSDGAEPRILARRVARDGAFPEADPSVAILEKVFETEKAVRLENALESPFFGTRPSVLSISVLSVLAVPLPLGPDVLACVYLDSIRLTGIFSLESEQAAVQLAATVAPGIERLASARASLERERRLLERIAEKDPTAAILGESPKLRAALERALKIASSEAPVLVCGESGTGKELFARAIHAGSARAKAPFVAINCGALPEATLEAELFGYVKGSFTGATSDRAGRFEAADGGTFFLDEVGDMPPPLQVKLLRVLQTGEIQKLGDPRERRVSVRIVAATHRDLGALVREGRFREDLLYRLRVVTVEVPPLRERGDDVILLAEVFARRMGEEQRRPLRGLGTSAVEALRRHRFPGNVRELENVIRHATIFAAGPRITAADLPPELAAPPEPAPTATRAATPPGIAPRDADELKQAKEEALAKIERAFVTTVLERAAGNVSQAARLAGMNRTQLHELMARHEVQSTDFKKG